MNRLRICSLVVALALASAGTAFAHGDLESSSPAAGATVKAAPTQVSIMFTEDVEPRFSGIEVQDAQGQRVDQGEAQAAPDNAKMLSVGLKPLAPGTYKVIWHNLSIDSHKKKGSFEFTVQP